MTRKPHDESAEAFETRLRARLSDKYEELPKMYVRGCHTGTADMVDSRTRKITKMALIIFVTDDGARHEFAIDMPGADFLARELRETVVEDGLLAE